MKKILLFLLLLVYCTNASAQDNWDLEIRFGTTLNFNQSFETFKHKFPGLKFFVSSAIGRRLGNNNNLFFNYGTSLAIYGKSLGNNLNPLNTDIQIDFSNLMTLGYGAGQTEYFKYMRTLGNSRAYTIKHDFDRSVMISTQLVLNNHKRHQAIGAYNFTWKNYSINYYNDGGAGMNILPIMDNFDRWWTGGGGLYVHNSEEFNSVEFTFDQFTGYAPLIYELSTLFGLNVSKYDYKNKDFTSRRSFNSSEYNLAISLDRFTQINVGVNGSLRGRTSNGKVLYFAVQDLIHLNRVALHPNNAPNRFHIGVNYSQNIYNDEF